MGTCGCPQDPSLVELYLFKVPNFLPADQLPEWRAGKKPMRFTPRHLRYVQNALQASTGLDVDGLMLPKLDRLKQTALWALKELEAGVGSGEWGVGMNPFEP